MMLKDVWVYGGGSQAPILTSYLEYIGLFTHNVFFCQICSQNRCVGLPPPPSNPDRKSASGKNKILGKAVQQIVWETSQNLSENTGETLNKYPAHT